MLAVQRESGTDWCGFGAPLKPLDPWCVRFPQPLTVGWEADGIAVAGFGIAAERTAAGGRALELLGALQEPGRWQGVPPPEGFLGPWFGGLAFDFRRPESRDWVGFPPARFILPELLVVRCGDVHSLWAFGTGARGEAEAKRALVAALGTVSEVKGTTGLGEGIRAIRADRPGWDRLVARALEAIDRRHLSKLVAARRIEVELSGEVDPLAVAQVLRRRAGHCAAFIVRGRDGACFLGATPERLCRIRGSQLETEALASSARPSESAALAREDKEKREHSAVVDGIRAALEPLAQSLSVGAEPRVLELPYVLHLRTPVRAQLKPGVGTEQVLAAMYPTAAVGGSPRESALQFLTQEEGWDRGWYAGALGWVGAAGADLHVAIRSAWLQGQTARVFVGAGLVAGSVAEREWQETEDKARPMLQALGGMRGLL